jgi:hypothetical protein
MSTILLLISLVLQLDWQPLTHPTEASLRGVAGFGGTFICVAGTRPAKEPTRKAKPVVFCSDDGGKTWIDRTPVQPGVSDYRCVAIPKDNVVLVASAGSPAVILRSEDRGASWNVVYKNADPDAFIDSMRFQDAEHGIVFGDPINGRFLVLATNDAGRTWQRLDCPTKSRDGEAGFAASNGLIAFLAPQTVLIGMGGGSAEKGEAPIPSRALRSIDFGTRWTVDEVPQIPAGPSSGIFAIGVGQSGIGHSGSSQAGRGNRVLVVAVGGDYRDPELPGGNIAISDDAGSTWRLPTGTAPRGFRSSVVFVPNPSQSSPSQPHMSASEPPASPGYWLATGPTGTDISLDGEDWYPYGHQGFHAATVAWVGVGMMEAGSMPSGSPIVTGSDGRVAIMPSPSGNRFAPLEVPPTIDRP